MDSNREQYNNLWSSAWGDMQAYGPVHRHALERLVRAVAGPHVKSILDVGCASGENLRALSAEGKYVAETN